MFRRSGYRYTVAVALSLFLGWLGADRFYLGYPALGKAPSPLLSALSLLASLQPVRLCRTTTELRIPIRTADA